MKNANIFFPEMKLQMSFAKPQPFRFGFNAVLITVDGGCLKIYIVSGRIAEIYKVFMQTVNGLRSGWLNASCETGLLNIMEKQIHHYY